MFIETRFFDDGRAEARLSKTRPEPDEYAAQDKCDYYVDKLDDILRDWIFDNLEIELEIEDTFALITLLEAGGWVSISKYI